MEHQFWLKCNCIQLNFEPRAVMRSTPAIVVSAKILFVAWLIIKILINRLPDCDGAEFSRIAELTDALKHVVERHTALECHTMHFQLQWSTPSGKQLLLDIVTEVVPTIVAHSVTLSTPEADFLSGKETHIVWLFDTLQSFNVLEAQMSELAARNPNFGDAVYLLVFASLQSSQNVGFYRHLQHMLRPFHTLNIFTANVMLTTPRTSDGVRFYTYIPFQEANCHGVRPHLINTFRNGTLKRADIFLPRISNFHGCPFRVMAMTVDPFINVAEGSNKLIGFEGEIINTIAKKLNASLVILPQPNETSSVMPDGAVSGFFRQLRNNSGDFIVGLQFLNQRKMSYFTPSVSYYTTPQVLVVLKGEKVDSNSNWLFSPFTNKTWLYVGLCCVFLIPFGAAIQYTFSRVEEATAKCTPSRYVVLNVFALILGISQSLIPKRSIYRLAFAATTLSLLVLRSIYQAKIYDDYRSIELDESPDTLEELVRRNFTILTTYAFDVPEILTQNSENSSGGGGLQVIRNDVLPEQNFELLQSSSNSTVAITTSYTYYIYYVNEFRKHGVFKVLQQRLVTLEGCLYFRRKSYIQQEIDSIINRLEPSGILSKWTSEDANRPVETDSESSHAIDMDKLHLVTLWYLYFCILAILVFIGEVLYSKYYLWKEVKVSSVEHIEEIVEID